MKIKKKQKIPTLVGLSLLLIILGFGIGSYLFQDSVTQKNKLIYKPIKIEVVNVSSDNAAITWQTNIQSSGQVFFGVDSKIGQPQQALKKDPKEKFTHFIPLKNLNPNTKYYFKIKSGEFFYPDEKFLDFTTAANLDSNPANKTNLELNQPLAGTVIDSNFELVSDALVFLNIENATKIATTTNSFGNFILPLKNLLTSDLKKIYLIKPNTPATLQIIKGEQISNITFTLPINNQALSNLELGRNINLKDIQASISIQPTPKPSAAPIETLVKFDLNNDGKVNSVDLSLIVLDYGKRSKNLKTDLNLDGLIDSDDVDLLQGQIK